MRGLWPRAGPTGVGTPELFELELCAVDLSDTSGGSFSMSASPESIMVCTNHAGGRHSPVLGAGDGCPQFVGLAVVPVACRLRRRSLTFSLILWPVRV